ncbi:MAG: Flp family type IVb pilin [Beijerinckiaceae bacterium]
MSGSILKRFLSDESGSTAIEYALLAAFLGLGIILSLSNLKNSFAGVVNTVDTSLSSR